MKKAIAVFLSLLIVLAAVSAACAEELDWSVREKDAAQIDGAFHSFPQAGLKAWIPSFMKETELSEQDIADGYLSYFADDSNSHIVAVMYLSCGITSAEEYSEKLAEIDSVSNIRLVSVNGIPAVQYNMESAGTTSLTIVRENGYVFEMTVFPAASDDGLANPLLIFSSVQAE